MIRHRCRFNVHFSRRAMAVAAFALFAAPLFAVPLRLDCGPAESPLVEGFTRLTADEAYTPERGYGWVSEGVRSVQFENPGFLRLFVRPREEAFDEGVNDLNRDAVLSEAPLQFRADVPDGEYRVSLTIGDMTQAIGSMDLFINGELAETAVTAFTPGAYRDIIADPYGWWTRIRRTVKPKDGAIVIELRKNQSHYDEQMAIQSEWDNPFAVWYPNRPADSFDKQPPYEYIGFPFVHNSLMAIEILPAKAPSLALEDGKLVLSGAAPAEPLKKAVGLFNDGDYAKSLAALADVPDSAQPGKAILALHLAGRLEIEEEESLVPAALPALRDHVKAHPDDIIAAEHLSDAEEFYKGLRLFLDRSVWGTNHFIEKSKAIGWLWLLKEDSPLHDKAQLHIARAAHMHRPYRPTLATERQIFERLEKKHPDNRFVKYHLHYEWENFGDGTKFMDWHVANHEERVKDSPEWVREVYVAFSKLIDLSEWWINFKQFPDGSIGGGLSDDVEMVGAFGYVGYIGRGISERSIEGARRLVDAIWRLPEAVFSAELNYQTPCADTEHTGELTGDSLPMAIKIDYGNPKWIERSMGSARLMRDLWTAPNDHGHRHFRANFIGATQVGSGDQANDSWINFRAAAPVLSVLWYNQNPGISQLIQEIADGWLAAAMSTDRGKPQGVIPAQVSFPEGLLGGTNSPNWWTASHPQGTVNYDWPPQSYKDMMQDILITAYQQTGDEKYVEPLRLEYELARKYRPGREGAAGGRGGGASPSTEGLEPGSEEWVAATLRNTDAWTRVQRMIDGREGELENTNSREQIAKSSAEVAETVRWRWPLMTTEASATDRVYFGGWFRPLLAYAGGRVSGRGFEAAITYENTTRHFAAGVLADDPQGFRLLYHSLTDNERTIGLVPWELEPGGTYRLRYGPDLNEDDTMDSVAEERTFKWRQRGEPIYLRVEPRVTYVIEVDQVSRGMRADLAPDPAITGEDIRKIPGRALLIARVHNIGSLPVKNLKVAFYDGDPEAGGTLIGTSVIPSIEAPVDLSPKHVTVGVNWAPTKDQHEIYVVVDPDDDIKDEITTFNNVAHTTIHREPQPAEEAAPAAPAQSTGGRGRR